MPIIEGTNRTSVGASGRPKAAVALYDFAVDGGAVGDIALRGDQIPASAVIVDTLIVVDTAVTGGGSATLALKAESAADLQAAAAVTGAPWSTTTPKRASLTATSAPVRTTAARTPTATVATAALTAGKFTVVVWYVEL